MSTEQNYKEDSIYSKEKQQKIGINNKPKGKGKYKTNSFYHYAEEYRKLITEETEIEKIDITELFYKELVIMHKEGELINININGTPTSGKSTAGFALAYDITKECFKREFGIRDIDRDQQEFSKTMRDPKIKNTVRVIDEWNEMEETGENVTVQKALYNYFSDVMAQRYVHKISCSPKESIDKNALIYLEVISTNKKEQKTYCKVYYRLFAGGIDYQQLIGVITIDVSKILNKEWYKEYRRRKFEKMDLILNEGIFRPRVLEYAGTIKTIVKKLQKLTKLQGIVNQNLIRNYVKMECRKNKIPQSIIGEELMVREVSGILDLFKGRYKLIKEVESTETKIMTVMKKGNMRRLEELEEEKRIKQEMRDEIDMAIGIQLGELDKYKEIHEKYNTILTE